MFIDHFSALDAPRKDINIRYDFLSIVFLTVCVVVSGVRRLNILLTGALCRPVPRWLPASRMPETLMTTIRQRFRRTPLIGLFACRYVDNNQLSIKSGVCRHAPSSQTLSQLCDKQYDSNTYRRHSTTLIKYH